MAHILCAIFMSETYILEKAIWNEEDFDQMGWHDAQIHAMTFLPNDGDYTGDLAFDIDYIFKWVHPKVQGESFAFWIAPCTLMFHDVLHLKMNIDTEDYTIEPLEISDIKMEVQKKDDLYEYTFQIELHIGQIRFNSYKGYTQIVRMSPKYVNQQILLLPERGGISFDRNPCK